MTETEIKTKTGTKDRDGDRDRRGRRDRDRDKDPISSYIASFVGLQVPPASSCLLAIPITLRQKCPPYIYLITSAPLLRLGRDHDGAVRACALIPAQSMCAYKTLRMRHENILWVDERSGASWTMSRKRCFVQSISNMRCETSCIKLCHISSCDI